MITDSQLLRYSRHILLNEFDIAGQEKLLTSTILVVGCGGLAHPALSYLVASGIGTIYLVDNDTVSLSNCQRQFLFTEADMGKPKVDVVKNRLQQQNSEVNLYTFNQRADESLLDKILPKIDLVLDCTDNFASRLLINRIAFKHKKILVSASALGFSGQLATYDFRQGHGPCYQCLFSGNVDDAEASCAKNGVFAPLLGIMGSAQACETLKILTAINPVKQKKLQCFNAKTFVWQTLLLTENTDCAVCHIKN